MTEPLGYTQFTREKIHEAHLEQTESKLRTHVVHMTVAYIECVRFIYASRMRPRVNGVLLSICYFTIQYNTDSTSACVYGTRGCGR